MTIGIEAAKQKIAVENNQSVKNEPTAAEVADQLNKEFQKWWQSKAAAEAAASPRDASGTLFKKGSKSDRHVGKKETTKKGTEDEKT